MQAPTTRLLSAAQQTQYTHLIHQLRKAVQETQRFSNGFAVRLPLPLLSLAASLIALEHRCHPFFDLHLDVTSEDDLWLRVTVPDGVQVEPLRDSFPPLM